MRISDWSSDVCSSDLIIHPILNVLVPQELQLHAPALVSLSCLLCRLGPGYVPFIVPARRKTQVLRDVLKDQFKALQQLDEYEDLVSRLLKHRPLPTEPQFKSDLRIGQLVRDRAWTEIGRETCRERSCQKV